MLFDFGIGGKDSLETLSCLGTGPARADPKPTEARKRAGGQGPDAPSKQACGHSPSRLRCRFTFGGGASGLRLRTAAQQPPCPAKIETAAGELEAALKRTMDTKDVAVACIKTYLMCITVGECWW